MRRRRLAYPRAVVLAALLLQTTGCSTWHTESGVSATALTTRHPSRVRLELSSGDRVELREPALRGDTLFGRVDRDSVRVPVADVVTTADRRFSAGRTASAVGLSLGVLFGLAALACAADPCGY